MKEAFQIRLLFLHSTAETERLKLFSSGDQYGLEFGSAVKLKKYCWGQANMHNSYVTLWLTHQALKYYSGV